MNTTGASDSPFRIDVAKADQLIAAAMPCFPAKRLELTESAGLVLRERIIAERDQPPFDRATMDGIAVRGSALNAGKREFTSQGIQAAGAPRTEITAADACMEIMTGAVMPTGLDTVIPVERTTRQDEVDLKFGLEEGYQPAVGQFVHKQASDHTQGSILLEPGATLRGPEMAILTAAGNETVLATPWHSIAAISTGDELVEVGLPIEEHQIRSSNDRAIEAALRQRGSRHITRAHLPDDAKKMLTTIRHLHDNHDSLILSGGVSMGKYDYLPGVLEQLGVRIVFHKILQRPGLPMWFGVSSAGKPVFALPGNPVSTLVCLVRYVIPALQHAMGARPAPDMYVSLAESIRFKADLCWFLPVKLEVSSSGELRAEPAPTNTSGDFIGLGGTDGFVELPRGQDEFKAGYRCRFISW
jgi:molybdopterin molybdotransferase